MFLVLFQLTWHEFEPKILKKGACLHTHTHTQPGGSHRLYVCVGTRDCADESSAPARMCSFTAILGIFTDSDCNAQ